jgi:hypothetical protein
MFRIVCSLVTDEELKEVLKQPVLVVLDEAYVEFALEPSRMQWVTEYENLIVLRTFSKRAGEYIYLLPQLVSMKWSTVLREVLRFRPPSLSCNDPVAQLNFSLLINYWLTAIAQEKLGLEKLSLWSR